VCVVAAGLDRLKVCSIRAGGVVVCCGGFDRKWDGDRGSTEVVLYMSRCGRMLAVYMWVMSPLLPLFVSRLTTLMMGGESISAQRVCAIQRIQTWSTHTDTASPLRLRPACRGIKSYRRPSLFRSVITTPLVFPAPCLPGPGVAFADDVPLMPHPAESKRQLLGIGSSIAAKSCVTPAGTYVQTRSTSSSSSSSSSSSGIMNRNDRHGLRLVSVFTKARCGGCSN
jgi:hypothetical protein